MCGLVVSTCSAAYLATDPGLNTFGCIGQVPTAIGAVGVKLLIVVFNDEALGAEYQKFVSKRMDARPAAIPAPDLGAVARALGCHGQAGANVVRGQGCPGRLHGRRRPNGAGHPRLAQRHPACHIAGSGSAKTSEEQRTRSRRRIRHCLRENVVRPAIRPINSSADGGSGSVDQP